MEYDTFPELLRGRLRALKLSQRGLSAELARRGVIVSENSISLWSVGKRQPNPLHLEEVLSVLGIYSDDDRARVYRFTYAPEGTTADPVRVTA